MSKVTYFTAAQKALEVLAPALAIPLTVLDLSTFIPAGTLAVIALAEVEQVAPGIAGTGQTFIVMKDAVQGPAVLIYLDGPEVAGAKHCDNCIIPVATGPQVEYQFDVAGGGPSTVNLRIWLIGYLS